jgi:hypothetical protein
MALMASLVVLPPLLTLVTRDVHAGSEQALDPPVAVG